MNTVVNLVVINCIGKKWIYFRWKRPENQNEIQSGGQREWLLDITSGIEHISSSERGAEVGISRKTKSLSTWMTVRIIDHLVVHKTFFLNYIRFKNQAKSLIKFLLKIVGEKESFDREFQEKTKESMRGLEYRRRGERSDRRALPPASKKRDYRDRERN